MSQKKVKQQKKSEKRLASPKFTSTNKGIKSYSGKASSSQKEKKPNLVPSMREEDSLSLSFVKNLNLSESKDLKDSDKKSMASKITHDQTTHKLDLEDPLIKQVKDITDQVKSEHQGFLSNLKEIL